MSNPLKIIILSIIFGLLSGIVGGLISSAYISPNQILVLEKNEQQITPKKTNGAEEVFEVYKKISPTILDIYLQKSATNDPLGQIYLEKDRVALGIILTSDGWIATRGKTFADSKNRHIIITSSKKIFTPQKTFFDEVTGVYFLKIEAENLPVPELGEFKELTLGEKIIIPTGRLSFKALEIENLSYKKNIEAKDLLLSSEKISKFILLKSSAEKNIIGAPLFNLNGELVGLANNEENTAMPTTFWQQSFLGLLKNEKIIKPYLGINYINLANAIGISEEFGQNKTAGALVWSNKALGISGVIKNSPAAKAGLKDGDIILKINSDEITAKTDLSEIINEYEVGAKVQITVLRDGKEMILEVELEKK